MDGSLCFNFPTCAQDTCLSIRKNRYICHALPFHNSCRSCTFCIPHHFPQSSISTMFQHRFMYNSDPVAGFCFVYMEDERDAEDAIRKLDRIEFGRKGRRLRIEWTKQERGDRRPDSSRKSSGSARPSKTLFVINFDPINTRTRDIEKYFEHYGKISNVRIRRNFAFVQYELQEDATRALEETHLSKFMDRVISVEYAIRDDDDKRNGYSPNGRGRDSSPDRRNYDRRRSPSPYQRDRGSPDYGHGSLPPSRSEKRGSPHYGRAESPAKDRYNSRSPRERSRSPPRVRSRTPPRVRSRSPRRVRSRS